MTTPIPTSPSQRRLIVWIARAVTYMVYTYILFVELVLFLGFFLLLFGANPSSPFTQWSYRNLETTMAPFRGIFAPVELGTAGNDVPAVFETSILFAMVVYGVVAVALHAGIDWLTNRIARLERLEMIEQAEAKARLANTDIPTQPIREIAQPTREIAQPTREIDFDGAAGSSVPTQSDPERR